MSKTIYLNLEDDVAKITTKLKREKSVDLVLVFPKQSFLFSDSINLKLLKKQVDLLGKKISILTMDEKGQNYAKEAGFALRYLPKLMRGNAISDIRSRSVTARHTQASITGLSEGFDTTPPDATTTADLDQVTIQKSSNAQKATKTKSKSSIKRVATKKAASATKVTKIAKVDNDKHVVASVSEKPTNVKAQREESVDFWASVPKQENFFIPPGSASAKPIKKHRSAKSYIVAFVAVSLIVVLTLVLVVLPSANIEIKIKPQSIGRDINVTANTTLADTNTDQLAIPAIAVNEQRTISNTFVTNGKKELGSKAEGRVAIYNLTGSPMTLRASTTTLTISGKTYLFKTDQNNVRALTSSSNDLNATTADIIATEGGDGFNVPAGARVEITNSAFGSQPQRLYAKTITQVIGGSSRFVSTVTKEDLDQAQQSLIKKVVEGLNANLPGGQAKLVDGAYTVTVNSFTPSVPEGTEAQNFTAELNVNISGLAFDESALKNLVRQRIILTLGAGKSLQDASKDNVVYQIKNLDLTNGLMQLAIHYESVALPVIDTQDLQTKLTGKSQQAASEVILANPDIQSVEIQVQPTWQSGLPKFSSKIHISIQN